VQLYFYEGSYLKTYLFLYITGRCEEVQESSTLWSNQCGGEGERRLVLYSLNPDKKSHSNSLEGGDQILHSPAVNK